MVRTTLGAEVDTTVTVSGSESVDFLDSSQSGTVSANSTEFTNVRAPPGSVYELLAATIVVEAVPGSSSGTHRLIIRSESQEIEVLTAESTHSDFIVINDRIIEDATVKKSPSTEIAQQFTLSGLRADSSNGFQLRYDNNTSTDQTEERTYRLWVREIKVSE